MQTVQVQQANKQRQPHYFHPENCIILNTRNLPLGYGNTTGNALKCGEDVNGVDTAGHGARMNKALQQKYMGPFTLGNQHRENAFELDDIPDHLRVHKMFNASLFRLFEIDDTQPQALPPPVRVAKSGASEYEIK
jgi:hypothetical protein